MGCVQKGTCCLFKNSEERSGEDTPGENLCLIISSVASRPFGLPEGRMSIRSPIIPSAST